ncbi:hypothetical protein Q8F55_005686 [Vanrija albida]|uniref:Beta-glucuronidase C-terminal domain-containing protein n=1 Tax=Vanrija albida TaxID=181172 RepID=A0ABR3Q2W4_9TREE
MIRALWLLAALAPINALTLYTPTSTVTVITITPTQAATGVQPAWTGHAAYDPTVLIPPAPPSPPVTKVDVAIPANPVGAGFRLSIPQQGNFLGFSIELSVATAVMGKNAGKLEPAFLNYMVNLKNRARAGPIIRVGGNTQDSSSMVLQPFADGDAVDKIKQGPKVTSTPIVSYSLDLLYMMANVTSLVGTDWFFGLPFNESTIKTHDAALVAKTAENVLGSKLRALSLGNEPDLYAGHQERNADYNLQAYLGEFSEVRNDVIKAMTRSDLLAGPSVCCSVEGFDIADVLGSGWLTTNAPYLSYVTIQRYPFNNCGVNGKVVDPQVIFSDYLSHTGPMGLTAMYLDASNAAQAVGKPIIMQEMNTASCGDFPGVSDSFGAALWMTDWTLQLAWANFSAALMHVGGQNVYYNPFTPPASAKTGNGWTTGSVYYSALVVAEALGSSNTSQVIDLFGSSNTSSLNPAYIIYEGGVAARAVLFNYVSDPSGASDYTAAINIAGSTADHVNVRYLRSHSIAEHNNITWAGQTLGPDFQGDGRLYGTVDTRTVPCSNGVCNVVVPAPSIALVFLTDTALSDSTPVPEAVATFRTTVVGHGSATVDPQALETSNGSKGGIIGTSGKKHNHSGAQRTPAGPLAALAAAVLLASML